MEASQSENDNDNVREISVGVTCYISLTFDPTLTVTLLPWKVRSWTNMDNSLVQVLLYIRPVIWERVTFLQRLILVILQVHWAEPSHAGLHVPLAGHQGRLRPRVPHRRVLQPRILAAFCRLAWDVGSRRFPEETNLKSNSSTKTKKPPSSLVVSTKWVLFLVNNLVICQYFELFCKSMRSFPNWQNIWGQNW